MSRSISNNIYISINGNNNKIYLAETKDQASGTFITKLRIFIEQAISNSTYRDFLLKTVLPVSLAFLGNKSPPIFN